MHSYNSLEKADTIAEIVKKLPLEALDKFCWINSTWYKEIQHEFWRRWKIQVLEYHKLECEREFKMDEVERKYPYDYFMQGLFHQDIENFYTEREIETAKKQYNCSISKMSDDETDEGYNKFIKEYGSRYEWDNEGNPKFIPEWQDWKIYFAKSKFIGRQRQLGIGGENT
ncbi:unnamed protein product [Rhizophagus irregularis]|nr:unnamed protein product [Rhizophagus irregularis]